MPNGAKLLCNLRAVIPVFLMWAILLFSTYCPAEDRTSQSWFRLKKGFRSGHNFGSQVESELGVWSFRANSMGQSFNAEDVRQGLVVSYGFHILSYGKVGFEMGSTFGRHGTLKQSQIDTIELPVSYRLPTLKAGVVWNMDINHRLRGGVEIGLERYENSLFLSEEGKLPTAFTMDFATTSLQYDYFFSNSWCLTFGFANKRSEFNPPKNIAEGLNTFLESSFSYRSRAFQLGIGFYLI